MRVLDAPTLSAHFLPRLLPPNWRGQALVAPFTPGQQGQPSLEVLQQAWEAMGDSPGAGSGASGPAAAALTSLSEWPLVPALVSPAHAGAQPTAAAAPAGDGKLLTALCTPAPGLIEQGSWAEAVTSALAKLGCRLVDASSSDGLVASVPSWVRRACIAPPTGAGALAAIAAAGRSARWQEVAAGERDALRDFLLQVRKGQPGPGG